MAKVIQAFRERYHNFKLYNIGDEYPENDKNRMQYLVEQGFLSVELESKESPERPEESGSETEPEEKPKRRKKGVSDDGDSDA